MLADSINNYKAHVDQNIRWRTAVPFVLIHLVALLAFVPSLFSWTGLLLVPIGNYIFATLGISLCYHRLLTHKGLRLPKPIEHFFAVLGLLTLQDTPIVWVAVHRQHHKASDKELDPHSPVHGFWWSHFGWMLKESSVMDETAFRLCPDLMRDRFYKRLQRKNTTLYLFLLQLVLFAIIPFVYELLTNGSLHEALIFSASVVVWGVFVRQVYVWHVTFAVNSISHKFGYRNYNTSDQSTNNWAVALLTNGEGWHNNHHADQRSARIGHKWWELDLTYLTIAILASLGVATDVVQPQVGKALATNEHS